MKENIANNNNKKLHNPKSHSPSIYIPCWLSQVSIKKITPGAKLLYGRLTQWSTEHGQVFRSAPQLSEELGTSIRQIERQIKELKDLKLLGTFHPQAGGLNHFEFYEHPWMTDPINKNLVYKEIIIYPPTDMAVPPDRYGGTLPTDMADINKKEIKENKCVATPPTQSPTLNPNCIKAFEEKFVGYDVTIDQLFENCLNYNRGKKISATKLIKWIEIEHIDNHSKLKYGIPNRAGINERLRNQEEDSIRRAKKQLEEYELKKRATK